MKIRGYFVFFVLLIFLLGAEGCPDKKTTTELGAYIGGVDGLEISFVDEEPPNTVLDNKQDPFYITLLVENVGEYTIPKGKIIATLSGISKDAFGLKSLNIKSVSDIFGKTKIGSEIIEGGLDQLQFDQANYKYDLTADFSTQLRADVCYGYKTNSLVTLCLKKNPIQRKQEDICLVTNDNVNVENSGAPLSVRNVKSRAGSGGVTVTFIVENKGTGEVYEPDTFKDSCVLKSGVEDRVKVKVKSKSDLNIKCGILNDGNSGVVKLIGRKRTVSCNIKTSSLQETAFEEPIDITLDYFYKEAIGKDLTVMNTEY